MDETKKTQGEETAEEVKNGVGVNNNLNPLAKSSEELTEEERQRQHDIRVLGGIARGKQRREQRTMREQAQIYLQTLMSKEQAKTYLGADAEKLSAEDMTVQGIMIAKMAQEAMQNGNAKAAEFVRDTSGQRPKDVVEVTANVMTDADRSLMQNMAEILGAKADKTE